jgi:DNA-binding NtrC family response regulator
MQSNGCILIVDDEEGVLFVLEQALAALCSAGQVVSASNGYDALRKIDARPWDLLITDIRLPGVDGIALTRALRARCAHTPVIWITAFHSDEILLEAARLGVFRCLSKPVEIGDIRQVSLQALRQGPAATPHANAPGC